MKAAGDASGLLVGRGRFGPEVKFGAVGHDLAPDGEGAKRDDGEDDQLLHGWFPYVSCFGVNRPVALPGRAC